MPTWAVTTCVQLLAPPDRSDSNHGTGLHRADRDRNGKIDRDGTKDFASADTNGDGGIDLEEWRRSGRDEGRFDCADRDRDRRIDRDEMVCGCDGDGEADRGEAVTSLAIIK